MWQLETDVLFKKKINKREKRKALEDMFLREF